LNYAAQRRQERSCENQLNGNSNQLITTEIKLRCFTPQGNFFCQSHHKSARRISDHCKGNGLREYNNVIYYTMAPLRVGIAGYMGAGKSTCCRFLAGNGIVIIDGDREAKTVMQQSVAIKQHLKDAFGEDIIQNGSINFEKLGAVAFSSAENLCRLNGFVHPVLREWLRERLSTAAGSLVIVDAALLPQWDIDSWFDVRFWIEARPETRRRRLASKKLFPDKKTLQQRMALQEHLMPRPSQKSWIFLENEDNSETVCRAIEEQIADCRTHGATIATSFP
jgi:dephospho-CoA kinase